MTRYIDLIEQAVNKDVRPDYGLDHVLACLADKTMTAWFGDESVIISENGPEGCLHLPIAAGNMSEIIETLIPQVKRHAIENGYSKLTGMGRFGWIRALKDIGVRPEAVYFTMDLRDNKDVV